MMNYERLRLWGWTGQFLDFQPIAFETLLSYFFAVPGTGISAILFSKKAFQKKRPQRYGRRHFGKR